MLHNVLRHKMCDLLQKNGKNGAERGELTKAHFSSLKDFGSSTYSLRK